MRSIMLILAAALFTGCVSLPPDTEALFEAKRNFEYVPDKADEWRAFTRTDLPFAGDCEDFAFSLQRVIGGRVHYVMTKYGGHAILIKDGLAYDNIYKWPVPVDSYPGEIGHELYFYLRGEVINNEMVLGNKSGGALPEAERQSTAAEALPLR